jgi:hypothetical protein
LGPELLENYEELINGIKTGTLNITELTDALQGVD